jgi:ABC-type sugar transport system ATPase subunit
MSRLQDHAAYQAPPDEIVAARNLCAHFGGERGGDSVFSIDSVSFEFPRGGTLAVIGPSGSGKTLLLKALAGLVPLDAGAFFFGSRRIDSLDARSRRVGLVFQDYALYPMMNGAGNIAFPRRVAGERWPEVGEEVERIARELGIGGEYLTRHIEALPEGVKQLVAIGRAENKPPANPVELFLMDEPLIHLDARAREETRAFLKRIVAGVGATTVYAFNDAADALALADWLLVLRDGRLVQFGAADAVFRRPADRDILELLSLNEVTALSGVYGDGAVVVDGLGATIPAALPDGVDPSYRGRASLVFRAEESEPAAAWASPSAGTLRARVDRAVPYGGERLLASGPLVPDGAAAPRDDAPRAHFLAPEGAGGIVGFRPTAAIAYPS